MVNVWVLTDEDHGETYVFPEDTDVLEIPHVKTELSYLVGAYDQELEEFKADVERAVRRGKGRARVEERFEIELKPMG